MDPHAEEKYLSVLCAVPVKHVYPDGRPYLGGTAAAVATTAAATLPTGGGNVVVAHRSERPYNCEYCTKSFAKRDKLNRHRKIHTGERSYKCEFCSRAFGRSDGLYRHRKVHTGEKSYQCDDCPKSFTRRDKLSKHQKSHTGGGGGAVATVNVAQVGVVVDNKPVLHFLKL
jgi:stress-induced morphogen